MKVVALPRASYFNEVVETDIFQILWRGKTRLFMPFFDANSRFEVDAVISRERALLETKILERYWLQWAGPMQVLRLDMSGSHMSHEFREWADRNGIRLGRTTDSASWSRTTR